MLRSEHTIFLGQQVGAFEVRELLAERTASNLYLAQDVEADRPVFLEILHPFINSNASLALQFRQRMERVAQLEHPNIAAVHEVGVSPEEVLYAAIKYVPGVSLAQKLAGAVPFTAIEALAFVRDIASALEIAHSAGIIHHDLRPENIIVSGDNKPILIDLGVPVVANVPTSAATDGQTDTLGYVPPEQLRGKKLTPQSNIYSLGVILYELLAGHRPRAASARLDVFDSATPPKAIALEDARNGLQQQTYRLVRECLRRQERARYDGMEQMLVAVDMAIAAESSVAPRSLTAVRFFSHRVWRVAAGSVILLALLLLLLWVGSGRSNAQVNAGQPGISVSVQATSILESALAEPTATATLSPSPTLTEEEPVEQLVPTATSDDIALTSAPSPTATSIISPTTSPTLSPTPLATPTTTVTPSPTPCVRTPWPTWVRYTIQRGDRLYPLALERDTLVEEIMRVNCLESDLLTVGQVIWLPPPP